MDFRVTPELVKALRNIVEGNQRNTKELGKTTTKIVEMYFDSTISLNDVVEVFTNAYFKYMELNLNIQKVEGEYETKGAKNYKKSILNMSNSEKIEIIVKLLSPETIKTSERTIYTVTEEKAVECYGIKFTINSSVSNDKFNTAFNDRFKYSWPITPIQDIIEGSNREDLVEPDEDTLILFEAHEELVEMGLKQFSYS